MTVGKDEKKEMSVIIPWDGWKLEQQELVHRGQFGTVYKISRTVFDVTEYAAMKIISIPSDQQMIETDFSYGYDKESIANKYKSYCDEIINEFKLMMRLKGNTNIVRCDDVYVSQHEDEIGWDVYIRMEYLIPFQEYHKGPVTETDVVKIGLDICNALLACEQNNIIHRDIKPSNILVSEQGDYKLGDFGVSRTLENESTYGTKGIGTYDYMSPEVYNGDKYGIGADIYSLGMVMYWLLNDRTFPFHTTGKAPTPAERDEAWKKRFSGALLPSPHNGSEIIKAIVLKACAFNPQDRYQTAEDLSNDLRALSFGTHTPTQQKREIDNTWRDSSETVGKQYASEIMAEDAGTTGKSIDIQPMAAHPQKNNRQIIMIVCIGIIVVALIIACIVYLANSKKNVVNPAVASEPISSSADSSVSDTDCTETDNSVYYAYNSKTPFFSTPDCSGLPIGFLAKGQSVKVSSVNDSLGVMSIVIPDNSLVSAYDDYYVRCSDMSDEAIDNSDSCVYEDRSIVVNRMVISNANQVDYHAGMDSVSNIIYNLEQKTELETEYVLSVKSVRSLEYWDIEPTLNASGKGYDFDFSSGENENGRFVESGEYIAILRDSSNNIVFIDQFIIGDYHVESELNPDDVALYITDDDYNVSCEYPSTSDHVNVWLFNLKASAVNCLVSVERYDGTYSWDSVNYQLNPRYWRGGAFQTDSIETIPVGLYLVTVREAGTNNILFTEYFVVN